LLLLAERNRRRQPLPGIAIFSCTRWTGAFDLVDKCGPAIKQIMRDADGNDIDMDCPQDLMDMSLNKESWLRVRR
jgi:hypothetical protein